MAPILLKSLLALSLASSAMGSPLDTRATTYAITGVQDSGVQARLEIRQLAADPIQFNLFLLAMMDFQAIDQSKINSFYQIAGIHGYPLVPWDGVQGSGFNGYCTHGSNLFGPWHRPYLSVFEQEIHKAGVAIAAKFPNNSVGQQYRAASLKLRIPYWDWAMNPTSGGILPSVYSNPTVAVTFPNGTQATVPNPLASYKFHPLVPADLQNTTPFSSWDRTLRWPTSYDRAATSQNDQAELQLEANQPNFRTQLMTLFSNYQRYNTFSNEGSGSAGFGNLESIHDTVHVVTGGFNFAGHMTSVPVAAFDPIFWGHHANIDRMLALWQAIYPDTYVDPTAQRGGTFTIASGSTQTKSSPLTPFHKDTKGTFFTSSDVRDTNTLGYSYPELINKPSNDTLKATIAALYAGSSPFGNQKRQAANNTLARDYLVKVELPWTAINGTYSVGVFLGKTEAAPADWAKDPKYVGMHATLGNRLDTAVDIVATSNVHLTDALLKKHSEGALANLEEDTIVSYLTENLEWRVQKEGNEIPIASLNGVKATAQSIQNAAPSAPGTFANFRWVGDFKEYPGVFGN
ncbi:di-copper centre-containing protein [Rutstroemia sp. NJR-2017a WRK4]|nr:di-copper centre-containing protein [Rutstroemia sp. NJR-2017a WRK4]